MVENRREDLNKGWEREIQSRRTKRHNPHDVCLATERLASDPNSTDVVVPLRTTFFFPSYILVVVVVVVAFFCFETDSLL